MQGITLGRLIDQMALIKIKGKMQGPIRWDLRAKGGEGVHS
jgi:hypothetical protein